MLRDKNLIPLSRQHQHALALCVRIDRASPIPDADLTAWLTEITQQFESEISFHFAAEEKVLFPVARRYAELIPLVEELLVDHDDFRSFFAWAKSGVVTAPELREFAERISGHIRKEERQLFERMQQLMTHEELAELGAGLDAALNDAAQGCALPNEVTRLRPAN